MPGNYKYIDHTADIAFEVSADNYKDLIIASADAWKEAVVKSVNMYSNETKRISLEESSVEEILVGLLSEFNYLLYTRKWVFEKIKDIEVDNKNNLWNVTVEVSGAKFDIQKHSFKTEVKAVTFHQMDVKYIDGKYTTRIVFDI